MSLRIPALASLDVRISKAIPTGENRHVDLVAESFNLLNHTNVTALDSFFGIGALPWFGRSTPWQTGNCSSQSILSFEAVSARWISFVSKFCGRRLTVSYSKQAERVGMVRARNKPLIAVGLNELSLSTHQFSTRTNVEAT